MAKNKGFNFSFNFSSLHFDQPTTEEERAQIPRLNFLPVAFEHAEEMADSIDYSQDYFCLVSGSFIFGDFLEALCFKKRLNPTTMYITTLGMGSENVDSLVNLVDYLGCRKLNLIVSHYFAGVERNKLIPYMEQEFSGKPVNVAVLQSHCKIALIRSEKGDCVISGSANLSSSNNVEQFTIMHDSGLVEYLQNRLDGVMEKFTILRGLESETTTKPKEKNTGKNAFRTMAGE